MFIDLNKIRELENLLRERKKDNELPAVTTTDNPLKTDYCMHLSCSKCQGTGRLENGTLCVHMLVCSCRKCSVFIHYNNDGR